MLPPAPVTSTRLPAISRAMPGTVQPHLLAVQQILDGDRLQFDFLLRRQQPCQARRPQYPDLMPLRRRQQPRQRVAGKLRRGDDQQVRRLHEPRERRLRILDRAQNIQPMHPPPDMLGRERHQPHHPVGCGHRLRMRRQKQFRRLAMCPPESPSAPPLRAPPSGCAPAGRQASARSAKPPAPAPKSAGKAGEGSGKPSTDQ